MARNRIDELLHRSPRTVGGERLLLKADRSDSIHVHMGHAKQI